MGKSKNNQWAKVFEVEDGNQILVALNGFNEDKQTFEVKISCYTSGVLATVTLGNEKKEACQSLFDSYNQQKAQTFFNKVIQDILL